MIRRLAVLAVGVTALLPSSVAAVTSTTDTVDRSAQAFDTARRDVQWSSVATCDLDLVRAVSTRHPDSRQLVVLATDSFAATAGQAFVAVRDVGGAWHCQTDAVDARFGRNGTRPLLERRSGDGTTPAGVFPLGETTAWDGQSVNVFGNRADPGVRAGIGYRAVRPQDCWGAVPGDAAYNKLVDRPGCPGPSNEWLQRFGDVYSHAVVIGANLDPISGDSPAEADRAYAAAIFLHRHSYRNGATRPTSGCVSLSDGDLVSTVRLLDPTLDPHFAIGPADWLRTAA
ncbi:MAG: hypothetical protein ABJH68_11315 [Ilumatobacter sp.]|uniref:hypothetical protein n=1 Tax=Ilumatobacter sp. TaxID=1967498 RepID=UPI003296A06E